MPSSKRSRVCWILLLSAMVLIPVAVVVQAGRMESRAVQRLVSETESQTLSQVFAAHGQPSRLVELRGELSVWDQPILAPDGATQAAIYHVGTKTVIFFAGQDGAVLGKRVVGSD